VGHVSWAGRLYGRGLTRPLGDRVRIYRGLWGSAPFQSIYRARHPVIASVVLMPEWYLATAALASLALLGTLWRPLLLAAPVGLLTLAASITQAAISGARASFPEPRPSRHRLALRGLTALLHFLQPLARLRGRLRSALTPWRRHGPVRFAFPRPRTWSAWSERWQSPEDRLRRLESRLRLDARLVTCGGDYDPWDLEVRAGGLGAVRVLLTIEEHGQGRQMVRFRAWPDYRRIVVVLLAVLVVGAALAGRDGALAVTLALGTAAVVLGVATFLESAAAMATTIDALDDETL
jgi:O-antigen biosynthesis protein